MWMAGPKSAMPSGAVALNPRDIEQQRAAAAGKQTAARTAASPPTGTIIDKLSNADQALDIIKQLKTLYEKGSPTDQDRQSWLNRVKQELAYTWGFDQPQNLDEDTALRSLGAVTAGRAFVQGRPNQQLMTEIWKHTGQNMLVSPDQMRDRIGIMERAVQMQKDRLIAYSKSGRGDLENVGAEVDVPGIERGEPTGMPTIAGGASPPTATSLSDWLNSNP
jgi:hypothetical protein